MVNIVIVGSGDIAVKRHIPGIHATPGMSLFGHYNRSYAHSEQMAAQYGGKAYASFEEVLMDQDVHAVLIATPTPSHYELAMPALCAKKHVLCEKPLACNGVEAADMCRAAQENNVKLMVCHVQRLYAPHVKARELVASGAIGRVLSYRTFLGVQSAPAVLQENQPPWKNAVAELGSHRIDLMRWIIGAEATEAFGCLVRLDTESPDAAIVSGDDNAMCLLRYDNGAMGMLGFSRTSYGGPDRTTTIFGTKGALQIYADASDLQFVGRDGVRESFAFPKPNAPFGLEITPIHALFKECIERDTTPAITGEDGKRTVETIDAILAADRTGTWQAIQNG